MINKIIYNLANVARRLGIDFRDENNPRVITMKRKITELNNTIEFKVEQYPDGSWTAESSNIDGIITGGRRIQYMTDTIRDATFTYFEIPPYLCRDSLLRADNEPVTVTQRVYV